jgi:hypothetical protein
MENNFRFKFLPSAGNNGIVVDLEYDIDVCHIKNIYLMNARFKPGGDIIIGHEVPMPLFWWQYARHEDPERNAGILISQKVSYETEKIIFNILSANLSRSIFSNYILDISYSEELKSYVYSFKAKLLVNEGCKWLVTPNNVHGEVEFCNFYPVGVFTKDPKGIKKYYSSLYENADGKIINIPHFHLDLNIYSNLFFKSGGRFIYILEDENPVIQILGTPSERNCLAGICSYMWDVHFGYKVCLKNADVLLNDNDTFESSFRLYSISRDLARDLLSIAEKPDLSEIEDIPVYQKGLNTFSYRLSGDENTYNLWQWQKEVNIPPDTPVKLSLDKSLGYSDNNSLYINLKGEGTARWVYTSLGPEFGGDEFALNKKYVLKAIALPKNLGANSFIRLGFRIHYKDEGEVFNLLSYKYYYCEKIVQMSDMAFDWQEIICKTPVISSLPDRVHLLLELEGKGECWFDDVCFGVEGGLNNTFFW